MWTGSALAGLLLDNVLQLNKTYAAMFESGHGYNVSQHLYLTLFNNVFVTEETHKVLTLSIEVCRMCVSVQVSSPAPAQKTTYSSVKIFTVVHAHI